MKNKITEEKRRRASYLFDELGEVDDCYLAGAEKYRVAPKVRHENRIKTVFRALAACLALVLTVRVGILIFRNAWKDETTPPNKGEAGQSLSQVLTTKPESGIAVHTVSNLTAVNLFTAPALIWQNAGGSYSYVYLDRQETETLVKEMRKGGNIYEKTEDVPAVACWLALGNGLVFSPYLRYSTGNIGYGECFTYDPETEPSEEFVQTVYGLLHGV